MAAGSVAGRRGDARNESSRAGVCGGALRRPVREVRRMTPEQRQRFEADGYVALPGVFSKDELAGAIEVITGFARADLGDPKSWYRLSPDSWSVVPLHH